MSQSPDKKSFISVFITGIIILSLLIVLGVATEKVHSESDLLFRNYTNKSGEWYKQDVKIGSLVTFGHYEQDNNLSNGNEPIIWRVLDIVDGKAVLISAYGIDKIVYYQSRTGMTWEKCYLREWLNEVFYNNAFSDAEKDMIVKTQVDPDKNPKYSTDPGNTTHDYVYILSASEVKKYFESDNDMLCYPTNYSLAKGAFGNEDYSGTCVWWTRTPGFKTSAVAICGSTGGVYYGGDYIDNPTDCVRPVIQVGIY